MKNAYVNRVWEEVKAKKVIRELFFLYTDMLKPICEESKIEQIVIDYISGMTDVYALDLYHKINGNSLPIV